MKTLIIVSALAFMTFVSPTTYAHTSHENSLSKSASTQMAVKDLWVDHIFWIRSVVVAKADKNKKAETLADQKVVENATLPTPSTSKQKDVTEKLTSNAIEIATFLSGANPHLPKDTLVNF